MVQPVGGGALACLCDRAHGCELDVGEKPTSQDGVRDLVWGRIHMGRVPICSGPAEHRSVPTPGLLLSLVRCNTEASASYSLCLCLFCAFLSSSR